VTCLCRWQEGALIPLRVSRSASIQQRTSECAVFSTLDGCPQAHAGKCLILSPRPGHRGRTPPPRAGHRWGDRTCGALLASVATRPTRPTGARCLPARPATMRGNAPVRRCGHCDRSERRRRRL